MRNPAAPDGRFAWFLQQPFAAFAPFAPWAARHGAGGGNLPTGLLAWYRNDGTDWSGNGRDMASVNAPETIDGLQGVAGSAMRVKYSGTFGYYRLGDRIPPAGSFSVSVFWRILASFAAIDNQLWVQTDMDGPFNPAVNAEGINVTGYEAGLVRCYVQPPDADAALNDTDYLQGEFNHTVLTYDHRLGRVRQYHNAQLDGVANLFADFTDVQYTFMGGCIKQTDLQFVGVWDKVLDAGEVSRLYNNGDGFDPTA